MIQACWRVWVKRRRDRFSQNEGDRSKRVGYGQLNVVLFSGTAMTQAERTAATPMNACQCITQPPHENSPKANFYERQLLVD